MTTRALDSNTDVTKRECMWRGVCMGVCMGGWADLGSCVGDMAKH